MTFSPDPKSLKIAYIGGGSRLWARILMSDLACCSDLSGEIRLYDIDFEAAKLNERFGNWIHQQPEAASKWRYISVRSIKDALVGADFVVISIQPGSFEMMAHEIATAEKYGLYFPVGDTTGVPGLMRGLRSAMIFAGFANAIAAECPDAWVINYTNPMSICTRTLTKVQPELKVFGCCHEVFGTQDILAGIAQRCLDLSEKPHRDEITINVSGINHFTWIDRATYQGYDLLDITRDHIQKPGVLRPYTQEEVESTRNWYHDASQIKFELFKRYGILAAAGDRHLAEFVPGFTQSPVELFRWGIIRTPVSYRIEMFNEIPQMVRDTLAGKIPFNLNSSDEEAVRQIKAILGLGDIITNVNMKNIGQVLNLPLEVVVETNAQFSRDCVQPIAAGALPSGVHGLVSCHVANQEMIIEAAIRNDEDLAFQAVMNDPVTNLPIDKAWMMFKEIGFPTGF